MTTETMETTATAECRIYAACLASYNNGILHGRWIDVDGKDAGELWDEVAAMLAASPIAGAEEWAIHDHEGFGRMIGESSSFEEVAIIAEALTGGNALAFRWLVEDRGMAPAEAAERAGDVQIYWGDDMRDLAAGYAQELFEEMTAADERDRFNLWPFTCIDWEAAGRELVIGGDVDAADIAGERFLVTNANEF
ncbi:MAG TPA: antirestriction protein ArdA [Allosphingosinicella sp.]|nr:antirestriction protein ArdA [Allosphingosinicella sp.]